MVKIGNFIFWMCVGGAFLGMLIVTLTTVNQVKVERTAHQDNPRPIIYPGSPIWNLLFPH